jgi:hypothetical protein
MIVVVRNFDGGRDGGRANVKMWLMKAKGAGDEWTFAEREVSTLMAILRRNSDGDAGR